MLGFHIGRLTRLFDLTPGYQSEFRISSPFEYLSARPEQNVTLTGTYRKKPYDWYQSCTGSCEYNVLWPTKGAFLHKRFLGSWNGFWASEWDDIRWEVNRRITGEDMLMVAVLIASQQVSFVALFSEFKPSFFSLNTQLQALHNASREWVTWVSRDWAMARYDAFLRKWPHVGVVKQPVKSDEPAPLGKRTSQWRWDIRDLVADRIFQRGIKLPDTINTWVRVGPDAVRTPVVAPCRYKGRTDKYRYLSCGN